VVRVRSLVLRAAESHDGAECGLSCAVTTGEEMRGSRDGSGIRPGQTD
jgi:hypothetical protein